MSDWNDKQKTAKEIYNDIKNFAQHVMNSNSDPKGEAMIINRNTGIEIDKALLRLSEFENVFEFIKENNVAIFKYGHGYKAGYDFHCGTDGELYFTYETFGRSPLQAMQKLIKEKEQREKS